LIQQYQKLSRQSGQKAGADWRNQVSQADLAASHVTLTGELTVRTIANVRDKLAEALRRNDTVQLKFRKTGEVDLTFVQLVEAARRAAAEGGKQLSLATPAKGPLREILERGGFVGAHSAERTAFWLHGDQAQ
jgi:ABC-type transporter Mla MlaB component